jgi:hypothetical protein
MFWDDKTVMDLSETVVRMTQGHIQWLALVLLV